MEKGPERPGTFILTCITLKCLLKVLILAIPIYDYLIGYCRT